MLLETAKTLSFMTRVTFNGQSERIGLSGNYWTTRKPICETMDGEETILLTIMYQGKEETFPYECFLEP